MDFLIYVHFLSFRATELALSNLVFKPREPEKYRAEKIRSDCVAWVDTAKKLDLWPVKDGEPWKQEVHRSLRVRILIETGKTKREAEIAADEWNTKRCRS